MVCRALNLIRRESQELRPAVRKFHGQLGAIDMFSAGVARHDASHEIGHGRFHSGEHVIAESPPRFKEQARISFIAAAAFFSFSPIQVRERERSQPYNCGGGNGKEREREREGRSRENGSDWRAV